MTVRMPLRRDRHKAARAAQERFRKLLAAKKPEQAYQRFLEENTAFIPQDFLQNHGVHVRLVLRKLRFGEDYCSDLFFLSKSSDDWNCVFIELEKPQSKYFHRGTNRFHSEFSHALQQINTWRAWLSSVTNQARFTNDTIGFLRHPLHENECFFKFVLVYGRRDEYKGNRNRRSLIRTLERDDFKIITYDSLLDNPHPHHHDLYVGSRKNFGMSILGDHFEDDGLFSWIDPTMIEVSRKFHHSASDRRKWHRTRRMGKMVMEEVLPKLRVRTR